MPWCRTPCRESAARRQINAEEKEIELQTRDHRKSAATKNILSEEAPEAYKDVDGVIEKYSKADLARPIVRLEPLAGDQRIITCTYSQEGVHRSVLNLCGRHLAPRQ